MKQLARLYKYRNNFLVLKAIRSNLGFTGAANSPTPSGMSKNVKC